MSQERRANPRARIPGSFVHCEGAAGERIQADVLNLSEGGLFIPTAKPLPGGKRLTLRLQVGGASAPWWSALGRIIWVRETASEEGPAGMGVKLLDIEEEGAVATIARLVDERLRTHPPRPSVREKTVLGVGTPVAAPVLPPSDDDYDRPTVVGELSAHLERERTIQGLGLPANEEKAVPVPPARERSVMEPDPEGWDASPPPQHDASPAVLVAPSVILSDSVPPAPVPTTDAAPVPAPAPRAAPKLILVPTPLVVEPHPELVAAPHPAPAPSGPVFVESEAPESEPEASAAGVPRRRGGRWFVFLVLVAVGGAAAYRLQDRWLPRAQAMFAQLTGTPATPAPSPPAAPSAPSSPTSSAAPASASNAPAAPSGGGGVGAMASANPPASAGPSVSSRPTSSAGPQSSKPPARPSSPPAAPAPSPPAPPVTPKKPDDNPY